ncbi:peroxisomal leader peptide-processing protease isoform X2 [Pristis pectinata]|uniref:peroxisomal leader peptide-processing protease isoform X2 n=1 Tax=Pristis pectinata TaxID=685728 RepID=UPI00223D8393|nr:peroxisomal leader peptide-processing protease isoform X2 [Pristis pectinata]
MRTPTPSRLSAMNSPERCSCIVSASLRSGGEGLRVAGDESRFPGTSAAEPQWDGSWGCSGLLLDRKRGLVLCHGQIFFPFLRQTKQDPSRQPLLLPGAFHAHLQIHIQFPGACSNTQPKPVLPLASNDAGALDPQSESRNLDYSPKLPSLTAGLVKAQSSSQAEMLMVFPCPEFRDIFKSLFSKSDKWHFYNEDEEQELQADPLDLVWFALLRCPGWVAGDAVVGGETLRYVRSECLRKGQPLFSCASPFASFCTEIFMNTFSKGIVSNLAGERNAMILTDARCLPGTEGGGVYIKSQDLYYLAGLIVAPLCWKASEWVGLTLVCSITCILETIRRILNGFEIFGPPPLTAPGSHALTQLLGTVALLESDRVWGSGVVVGPRLIITCRHVLDRAPSVRVKIQSDSNSYLVLKGRVVFATKEDSAYDVAVVELEEDLSSIEIPTIASDFKMGIVSSNARNNNRGATYPHLNFSFPITVLCPLLSAYDQTRDATVFEGLNKGNEHLRALWRLQGRTSTPWRSKL